MSVAVHARIPLVGSTSASVANDDNRDSREVAGAAKGVELLEPCAAHCLARPRLRACQLAAERVRAPLDKAKRVALILPLSLARVAVEQRLLGRSGGSGGGSSGGSSGKCGGGTGLFLHLALSTRRFLLEKQPQLPLAAKFCLPEHPADLLILRGCGEERGANNGVLARVICHLVRPRPGRPLQQPASHLLRGGRGEEGRRHRASGVGGREGERAKKARESTGSTHV
eukprot:scaffold16086_cov33-Tisochrysis_lutea.AAC.1